MSRNENILMMHLSPLSRKRLGAFFRNRRAAYAAVIFAAVFILSLFSEVIANDKPLFVSYKGEWYFPLLYDYQDLTFGGDFPTPADYRDPFIRTEI